MTNSRDTVHSMEVLSMSNTVVHQIEPLQQFIVTLFFIVIVISFDKYSLSPLLPLFLYPALIIVLGEIPVAFILKMILPALPLVIFMGAANPLLDTADWVIMSGISINAGWISALTLLIRSLLTLMVSLIFIATSGIQGLVSALKKMKIPDTFINLLSFTYRYIHVLMEEAGNIIRAYNLRSSGKKGIALKNWGSLGGQWFIRSYKRADSIHAAMSCRGFTGQIHTTTQGKIKKIDYLWSIIWCIYFLLCRLFNLPELLGKFIEGLTI
jgi:cobalt/nickel transport system permease protein